MSIRTREELLGATAAGVLLLAAITASCLESGGGPLDAGTDGRVCVGENPAHRCRTAPSDCVPSACGCSDGAWLCTADCGGGRHCSDGGTDASAETLCTSSGGMVGTAPCCLSAAAFPDTCSVGACGCAPASSHSVPICTCPAGACFSPARGCVRPVCTPGMDQTCNDDPSTSSLHGRCLSDRTCACGDGFPINPATGRCR